MRTYLVVKALSKDLFKAVLQIDLTLVLFEIALLLAVTSAKRVSDLYPLSVHPSCLRVRQNHSVATLREKPSFTSQNISSSFTYRMVQLDVLCHLSRAAEREEKLDHRAMWLCARHAPPGMAW